MLFVCCRCLCLVRHFSSPAFSVAPRYSPLCRGRVSFITGETKKLGVISQGRETTHKLHNNAMVVDYRGLNSHIHFAINYKPERECLSPYNNDGLISKVSEEVTIGIAGNLALQGHPKVNDFGTNWKRTCNFLVVSHSKLGCVLHRFWDRVTYWLKIANFSYPSLNRCLHSHVRFQILGWS